MIKTAQDVRRAYAQVMAQAEDAAIQEAYPGLSESWARHIKTAGLADSIAGFGKSIRAAGTASGNALRAKGVVQAFNEAGEAVGHGASAGKGAVYRATDNATWGDAASNYAARAQRAVGHAIAENPEIAGAAGGGLMAYGAYRGVGG